MLRIHDVVLAEGNFRVVLTPKRRVIAAIDAPNTLLGPIHVAVEVDRRALASLAAHPHSVETAGLFGDIGDAIGHAAEGAFNTVSKVATTVSRPVFDIVKTATGEGAHALSAALPFLPDAARHQLDAASRVIMRARLGDVTAKQFIRTVATAAKAGVQGASHVADALLDASKVVAKAVDVPVAITSHVPILGNVMQSLSPFQKFSNMTSALQRGDFGAIQRMARDELALAQSAASMVPGIGTGISSAISAGLAAIDGGSPLEVAIRTAYGAIPIPPGIRQITDLALSAALALIAHPNNLTDAALQVARDRLPQGLPRDVFDTLAHLIVHRMPIQKAGASLVNHFVQQYAGAGEGLDLADALKHVASGTLPHFPSSPFPSSPAASTRLVQPFPFVH